MVARIKISDLPNATLPLSGSEQVPIVQSGATVKTTSDGLLSRLPATVLTGSAQRTVTISTKPTTEDPLSTSTLFSGNDLTNTAFQLDSLIESGASGTPTTNYLNLPTLSQVVWRYNNQAGFNTDAGDHALGRSGIFRDFGMLLQNGQGDLVANSIYAELNSARPGATHWLANPAVIVHNGTFGVTSGGVGGYLNESEYLFADNGYAVSVISTVRNYIRNSDGDSLGQVWVHDRAQSGGTYRIDAFYSPSGLSKVGYDATAADFGATKAAMAVKQDDRIYLGASSTPDSTGAKWYANTLGTTYLSYDGTNILAVVQGDPTLQVGKDQTVVASPLYATGVISAGSGTAFQIGSNTVLSLPASDTVLSSQGANAILFYTNSTERFRIGPAGQFGVAGANYGTSGYVLTSGGASAAPSWAQISVSSVTGTLGVANGGTGVTGTPTNGQLLIGNGTGYTIATLTDGTNISVTNAAGSITINTTATPTFATSVTTPTVYGGTTASSTLTLQSTSGSGTTDYIAFLTGSASERARINASGVNVASGLAYQIGGTTVLDNLAWSTWTPTVTPESGTITTLGTVTGRYKQIGKTVFFNVNIPITTNGTGGGGYLLVSLAVAARSGADVAVTGRSSLAGLLSGYIQNGNASFVLQKADGSYPGQDGATLNVSGTYEIS